MDLYDEIVRLRKIGQKCAVATIVQVNGSIPSYESAKMLVREDGTIPRVMKKSWQGLNTFRTNTQVNGGGDCRPPPPNPPK